MVSIPIEALDTMPHGTPFDYSSDRKSPSNPDWQEKDRILLRTLHARIQSGQEWRGDDLTGYPFRNREIAELVGTNYSKERLKAIDDLLMRQGTLAINVRRRILINGDGIVRHIVTIGASDGETGNHMSNAIWIRDQVQCARSFLLQHEDNPQVYGREGEIAKQVLLGAVSLMSTPPQLDRFDAIIRNREDTTYIRDASHWPYIFFSENNLNGDKTESWSHKQDAWQMAAVTMIDAIEQGVIGIKDLTEDQKQFLGYVVPFLLAIDYIHNEDAGSWEEIEAVRTSTMAWNISLIGKIASLSKREGFAFLEDAFNAQRQYLSEKYRTGSFTEMLETEYTNGLSILAKRIPNGEAPDYPQDSPRYRDADAALLYLLDLDTPARIAAQEFPDELNGEVRKRRERDLEDMILQKVLTLRDPRTNGIQRYGADGPSDSYQRAEFWTYGTVQALNEYHSNASGATAEVSKIDQYVARNKIVPGGPCAAWTHFVSQIAAWAGRRYQKTGDERYYEIAEEAFNRALSLVTGKNEYSVIETQNGLAVQEVPAFLMPECYVTHVDPDTGEQFVGPSPHTPLNWSVAKLREAMTVLLRCSKIREVEAA